MIDRAWNRSAPLLLSIFDPVACFDGSSFGIDDRQPGEVAEAESGLAATVKGRSLLRRLVLSKRSLPPLER